MQVKTFVAAAAAIALSLVAAGGVAAKGSLVGPNMGRDPGGNVYVVWTLDGEARMAVHRPGGGWGTAMALSARTFAPPELAFDGRGNGLLAWRDVLGSVMVQARSASGRWSAPHALTQSTHPGSGVPVLAVNPAGRAIVAWPGNRQNGLEAASGSTTGSWSASTVVSAGTHVAGSDVSLALDGTGNATVLWTGRLGRAQVVFAAEQRRATGRWSAPRRLSRTGRIGPALDLVASVGGRALATWAREGRIEARLRDAYGRWGPTRRLSGPWSADPRAAMSASGDAAVAWTRLGRDWFYRAEVASKLPGRQWSTAALMRRAYSNTCLPQISFGGGRLVAGWVVAENPSACGRDTNVLPGSPGRLMVSTLAASGWARPRKAFMGLRSVARAQLIVAPTKTAVLAWMRPAASDRRTRIGGAAVRLLSGSRSTWEWR